MWTAIILAAIVAGGTVAYGAWALHAVAHGAPLWPFIVGIPFAYLAVPLLLTIFWFALAWWFRAERPDGYPPRAAGAHRDVRPRIRGARALGAAHDLLPLADAGPAAGACGDCPSCCCTASAAMRACGAAFAAISQQRGIGPVYALSYGPPLASIEHFADQVADTDWRHRRPPPAPRRSSSSATAWAGSWPAPICGSTGAPRSAG